MGNDMCREMVSAVPKAMRYTQNGRNLDLAHFKEFNLVVMAWPAETLSHGCQIFHNFALVVSTNREIFLICLWVGWSRCISLFSRKMFYKVYLGHIYTP